MSYAEGLEGRTSRHHRSMKWPHLGVCCLLPSLCWAQGTGIGGCYCAVLRPKRRPRGGSGGGGGGTEVRREEHTMRVPCPPANFEVAHEACALAMHALMEAGNMHNGRAAMAR